MQFIMADQGLQISDRIQGFKSTTIDFGLDDIPVFPVDSWVRPEFHRKSINRSRNKPRPPVRGL